MTAPISVYIAKFVDGCSAAGNKVYETGAEILENLTIYSPQAYVAGGLGLAVVKALPGYFSDTNPLHAALFTGGSAFIYAVVKPILNRIADIKDGKDRSLANRIYLTNTLATTAIIATVFALNIPLVKGAFLAAGCNLITHLALSSLT